MSLLDRIACRVEGCRRERAKDALYCREHLTDAWMNRLPEWRRRLVAKDMTNAA